MIWLVIIAGLGIVAWLHTRQSRRYPWSDPWEWVGLLLFFVTVASVLASFAGLIGYQGPDAY